MQVGGQANLSLLVEYLLAVRTAAGKVPPRVAITGAPQPAGVPIQGSASRCWFVTDWYDTPLRSGQAR